MDIKTVSFSGHESFPLRPSWLTKGVLGCHDEPSIFGAEEAMAILGVGKNMVRAIRHWCLATGMLEHDPTKDSNRGRLLRPTALGRQVFLGKEAWDPYLEDVGTVWLLHWRIATNPQKATTWHYCFNLLHQTEFSRDLLENRLLDYAKKVSGGTPSRKTLKTDVDVFVRTYVRPRHDGDIAVEDSLDCPLVELNLIRPMRDAGAYAYSRGNPKTLPDKIFLFAVADFRQIHAPNQNTMSFENLAYAPGSPGKVFKLDESALAQRLESVERLTDNSLSFSESAGLKQLMFHRPMDRMEPLRSYYAR